MNQIFNSSEKEKQFQLYVNNISFKIDNQTILHETSFVAQSSEMIGIIGKSGSGKSSLLYVLSGVYPIGKGDLFIKKDNKNTTYFQTSFVEQDNNFIDGFSVEEHLIDRAKYLQLSDDESYKKIKKILVQVDLYYHRHKIAKFNNSLNGELSGGQKKRLNIALCLLQNPDLILMDEPSSGLSSIETLKIFRLLKSISLLNKIVICSVHQPDISVFSMFDKIIVISEQGYPAFYGKPSEAAEYFRNTAERIDNESVFGQNYKPGVIIDILDDKKLNIQAQTWYQEYRNKNPNNKADIVDKNELNKKIIKLNWFLSVKEFITREIKILKKNPLITSLFLIIPILLAVLLSFISKYSISEEYSYYLNPNIPAWILMLLVSAIFIGLISSGHEFIYLRNYRKSENIIYYKFNSYAFSKIIKVFVITVFQALILSFLSAYIIEMKTNEFKFFLIVWLLCFFGATLGLLLSKLFSSISMVYFLAPLIIIPQILFAGAIIEYKNFNNFIRNEKYVPLIADLIPLRWASEAIMVDLFKNNKFEKNVFNANVLINEAVYYLDYFFPEFENINKTQNVRANFILLSENAKNHFFSKDNHKLITETANEIKNSYFNLKINSLNYRDSIYNGMSDKLILKKKYSNHALNNLLCKKHDFNNYIIEDFEIIRRYMPIYKLPDFDSYRTHFFSPYKRFFNRFIDTYWFNVLVLLLMTGLLMIFLFDYNKRQKKNYNSS